MLIMMHCIFIRGSLKINIFNVIFWKRGSRSQKIVIDNVDNYGRPLSTYSEVVYKIAKSVDPSVTLSFYNVVFFIIVFIANNYVQ